MSSEDQEEVFVLEKAEISVDDDEGYNYDEIKDSEEDDESIKKLDSEDSDDMEDFDKLKAKTNMKKMERETAAAGGTIGFMGTQDKRHDVRPKVVRRDVVIYDFIRNYLAKFGMNKNLNIFQD